MKKKELLARIEELERKLTEAETRIAWLEARSYPVSVPVVPDPYSPSPHWPWYYPTITWDDTTNGAGWVRPDSLTA